jgi:hypothetical protein
MNQSSRAMYVNADDVLKGGQASHKKTEKILPAGKSIYEVTDKLGKQLQAYDGFMVIEIVKEGKGK